ncbi:MAG: tetratricopeptide repeat protein [Bacillota bacterium]|nr:tetratricopeptide repeat protein [Bacillota bacterium]
MSKKGWIIISGTLAAVVIGLQVYEIVAKGVVDTGHLIRTGIIILALIASFIKKNSGYSDTHAIKKAYKRAYGELVGNAFEGKPAQEKIFYAALHNLNNKKPNAALDKLEDLRADCETNDERFAVEFFSGMCSDDLGRYDISVSHYERAAAIKHIADPLINAGFCYEELGSFDRALECLQAAVDIEPDAVAYNNIAQVYLEKEDYEKALEYANLSIELNPKRDDSLSAAAIAHAMLGHDEEYKEYFRRYLAAGGEGALVTRYIEMMKFEVE